MSGSSYDPLTYRPFGDIGLLVEYGSQISPLIHEKVMAMTRAVKKTPLNGVTALIPTYTAILFLYDPSQIHPNQLIDHISNLARTIDPGDSSPTEVIHIPVCYKGEYALDMDDLTHACGISQKEVIQVHSIPEYLIYMVGFTPGFAFLGGLDPRLHSPRLKTPRTIVPKGSVGIANDQTGIYSIGSPGGWKIIGRTPLNLFAPWRSNPFLYKPGDKIKFIPICETEFRELAQKEKSDRRH
ncbi:5-oxoprolinase subunit PxpB [Desulfobacula sp.]